MSLRYRPGADTAAAAPPAQRGSHTENTVPASASERSAIVPPWVWAMSRQM